MIDPVAIEIGPLQLHWYGIIIATAVLVAALVGSRVAVWLGENPEHGWSMLLPVVVVAIIGARIYHVIHLWDHYSANPIEIPQIWNGGIGIPGALAAGALAILWYTRSRGLNTARWLDVWAAAAPIGQAIGRLGNFVNQELYGPPTTLCGSDGFPPCLPFGIPIDAAHRAGTEWTVDRFPVETTQFVPLFAYEAVLNLIGAAVLLFLVRRYAHRLFAGDLVLIYVMWYGAVRAFVEGYRTGNWEILGVPTATWLGILAFLLAGAWLVIRHLRGWGSPMLRPADERAPDGDATPDVSAAHPPSEAPAG